MKILNILAVILLNLLFTLSAAAQCVQNPTTHAEFSQCNRNIAETFAPNVTQFIKLGIADRFVKVNFDGDFNSGNNWENTHLAWNQLALYYNVIWTEDYWYITYSFFYPRDHSGSKCPNDEHENDLERVLLSVRRSTNTAPAKLIEMLTTSHGSLSQQLYCNSNTTHPDVYISAGSHAIYTNYSKASNEGFYAWWCGTTSSNAVTYPSGSYDLVDVHDDVEGLWRLRNSTALFSSGGLKFNCTTGGGCNGTWFTDPSIASSPWNGNIGSDPSNMNHDYCNEWLRRTEIFNEYECDYSISASNKSVCNNQTTTFSLARDGGISLNNKTINWNYNTTKFQCVSGCGSNSTSITLRAKSNYSATQTVSATISSVDCGNITVSEQVHIGTPLNIQFTPNSSPVCNSSFLRVDESFNNAYTSISWSSPNLNISSYSNGNTIRVSTNITGGYYTLNYIAYNSCGSRTGSVSIYIQNCGGTDNDDQIDPVRMAQNVVAPTAPTLEVSPNPFSSSLAIAYSLNNSSKIQLNLYDLTGRLVKQLENGNKEQGSHQLNASTDDLVPGIYLVRLTTKEFTKVQKVIKQGL